MALLRESFRYLNGAYIGNDAYIDLKARIDAALAEPEPGKTVRVRCAVGFTNAKKYAIAGGMDGDEPMLTDEVMESLTDGFAVVHFANIEVPLPQAVEVEGECE